jgi:hypothetical protein
MRSVNRPTTRSTASLLVCLAVFSAGRASLHSQSTSSSKTVAVLLRPPDLTVGVLEGNVSEQFGELTAMAPQRGGRFAVLDARLGALRVFDAKGAAATSLGRPGSGPGEFRVPTSLAVISEDTVAVLDHSLSRISFFNTSGESKSGFVRSFQLDVPSRDFCALGKWLFVAGFRARDTSIVRRIDLAGAERDAFGDPFPNVLDLGLARMVSLQLRITCVPEKGLVLVASDWYPTIRAYTASTGELKWAASLKDFEQTVIEATAEGGVGFRPPPSQAIHKIVGLIPLDTSVVLVQLERTSRERPGAKATKVYEARLVRSATGEQIGSQAPFLRVLAATRSTLYLSDTTDYPKALRAEYQVRH